DLGCQTHFWRIKLKPGKPTFFGTLNDTLSFGLPGNPVASFVTFLVFCRRSLLKWMGAPHPAAWDLVEVPLLSQVCNQGDRPHYIRGRCRSAGFAPVGIQESHGLAGLCLANALLRLKAGENLNVGDRVQ